MTIFIWLIIFVAVFSTVLLNAVLDSSYMRMSRAIYFEVVRSGGEG